MGFSQRMGLKGVVPVQKDTVDEALRHGTWTIIYEILAKGVSHPVTGYDCARWFEETGLLIKSIWINFFKLSVDLIPEDADKGVAYLKEKFYKFNWSEFYDFIEFFASCLDRYSSDLVIKKFNKVFEQENSAYRFVDGKIIETVSGQEMQAVEDAAKELPDTVSQHIKKASYFIFDRAKPDYANSVKESASALEAFFRELTNSSKQIADILKEKDLDIFGAHPAIREVIKKRFFRNFYGCSANLPQ